MQDPSLPPSDGWSKVTEDRDVKGQCPCQVAASADPVPCSSPTLETLFWLIYNHYLGDAPTISTPQGQAVPWTIDHDGSQPHSNLKCTASASITRVGGEELHVSNVPDPVKQPEAYLRHFARLDEGVPIHLDSLPFPRESIERPPYSLPLLLRIIVWGAPNRQATTFAILDALSKRFKFFVRVSHDYARRRRVSLLSLLFVLLTNIQLAACHQSSPKEWRVF